MSNAHPSIMSSILTCDLLDQTEKNYTFIIIIPYIVWCIAFQKSSAKHLAPRRFSQKGFDISIFGHHRCPFSGIFLTLVQIRIEEITILIYVIMIKNDSIMVTCFWWVQKVIFWAEIFWHVTHHLSHNLHIFVLSNKTRNMHGVRTSFHDMITDARQIHAWNISC